MNRIPHITTINDFNKLMKQPTLHPLLTSIEPERLENEEEYAFTGNFYAVYFKHAVCGDQRYGRRCCDFQYRTVAFAQPGDLVRLQRSDATADGISGILFHPEVFNQKSLIFKKNDYKFFAYRENESLHVSLQEQETLTDCLKHIEKETRTGIDRHSLRLIAVYIELLLDYCRRFYERQFIVRANDNQAVLQRLADASQHYFELEGRKSVSDGVAFLQRTVDDLSPAYLSTLFKKVSGQSISDTIAALRIESACRYLSSTSLSLKEISSKCGYANQYYFSNSFKKKLGVSPSVYREQQPRPLPEKEISSNNGDIQ